MSCTLDFVLIAKAYKDELNLADIGIGVNGDGETKTALFCVIPDSDKAWGISVSPVCW